MPKIGGAGANNFKKRMQHNRPSLKIENVERNLDMSELEVKSPNLVIQPMAKMNNLAGANEHDDLLTPLSYIDD